MSFWVDSGSDLQNPPAEALAEAEAAANGGERPAPGERRKKITMSKEFFRESDLSSGVGRTQSYDRFSAGDKVSHFTFGKGVILSVREMGADILYEIAFDSVGTKKLMATYAKLKKCDD